MKLISLLTINEDYDFCFRLFQCLFLYLVITVVMTLDLWFSLDFNSLLKKNLTLIEHEFDFQKVTEVTISFYYCESFNNMLVVRVPEEGTPAMHRCQVIRGR